MSVFMNVNCLEFDCLHNNCFGHCCLSSKGCEKQVKSVTEYYNFKVGDVAKIRKDLKCVFIMTKVGENHVEGFDFEGTCYHFCTPYELSKLVVLGHADDLIKILSLLKELEENETECSFEMVKDEKKEENNGSTNNLCRV